jgi:hypothetical protein
LSGIFRFEPTGKMLINSLAEKQWQSPLQADISVDAGYLGATNNNEELLMKYDNNQDILASLYNFTLPVK